MERMPALGTPDRRLGTITLVIKAIRDLKVELLGNKKPVTGKHGCKAGE